MAPEIFFAPQLEQVTVAPLAVWLGWALRCWKFSLAFLSAA
jgi:hypothetical protein